MNRIERIPYPDSELEEWYNQHIGTLVTWVNKWFQDPYIYLDYPNLCGEANMKFVDAYNGFKKETMRKQRKGKFNTYLNNTMYNHTVLLIGDKKKKKLLLIPYDNRVDPDGVVGSSYYLDEMVQIDDLEPEKTDFEVFVDNLRNSLNAEELKLFDKLNKGIPLQGYTIERRDRILKGIREKYKKISSL